MKKNLWLNIAVMAADGVAMKGLFCALVNYAIMPWMML